MSLEHNFQRFKNFIDIVKGKVEVGSRLKPLLDPENLQTTTRLSQGEVDFVTDAHWLSLQWKVFEPLKQLAIEYCETVISEEGKGRKEAIEWIGALSGGKMLEKLMAETEFPIKKSRLKIKKEDKELKTE